MQNVERNERVLAILTRRDEIDSEIVEYQEQINALHEERASLDTELAELTGTFKLTPRTEINSTGRKCKLCGETSHISRDGKCRNFPHGKLTNGNAATGGVVVSLMEE